MNVRNGKASQKGVMPDSTILHLELVFKLRHETEFEQCLASLSDPTSSNYRHFLTAKTLQPYVPTPGDVQSVAALLRRGGFNVTYGSSPIVLELTGKVSTITRSLGTQLGLYRQGATSFYSPESEPRMPQNLGAVVTAITGLDNFSVIRPAETPCGSSGSPYCPQAVQVGYGFSNLFSSGHTGWNQTVAIVDAPGDPNIQNAINTYDAQYGLNSTTLNLQYPSGMPSSYNSGWAAEAALDVEAVHSVAPSANITLLYDTNTSLVHAIDYVASNHLAKIVSNSWIYTCNSGPCSDTQLPRALVSSVDTRLSLDTAQGLTILFASGDKGATPDGSNLGTNFPASDPNVLAVGGTNLLMLGCGISTCSGRLNEVAATLSGGGYSGNFSEPAWQTSTIGTRTGRAVPDVSMIADSPGFWVYSTLATTCGSGTSGGWFGCIGTSLSTQLWAGFLAIALQVRGGGSFGNIAPLIYQIGHSSSYQNDFHDITSGNNNFNLTCGHPTCGYNAVAGWDPATGWGSPVADKLVNDLSSVLVSTDKSGYTQLQFIHYAGSGLTANGKVLACISTNNDGNILCTTSFANNTGQISAAIQIQTNVPPGPQKFLLIDNATGRISNQIPLIILFRADVSDLQGFTGNSTGSILLVLSDIAANPHGFKISGVGYQSGRDTTPIGFISGMLNNTQPTIYDSKSAYVDSSGRPIGSYSTIIVIGGPTVNEVSYYYEHASTSGDRAPLTFSSSNSNYVWTDKNGTVVQTIPQRSTTVPPGTSDVFAIQVLLDSSGRIVVLIYGTTYMGTWAAAYYFKYYMYSNMSNFTNGYYLVRWTDATSGTSANKIPDGGDTFTILATGLT